MVIKMRKKIILVLCVAMLLFSTTFAVAGTINKCDKKTSDLNEGKYFEITVLKEDGSPAKGLQVNRYCEEASPYELAGFTDEDGIVCFDQNNPLPSDADVTFYVFTTFPPTWFKHETKHHTGDCTGLVEITVNLDTNKAKFISDGPAFLKLFTNNLLQKLFCLLSTLQQNIK